MKTPNGSPVRPTGFTQYNRSFWFCGDDKNIGCGRRWRGEEEGKDWCRGLSDLYALCRYCEGQEEVFRGDDEDTQPGRRVTVADVITWWAIWG